MGEVRVGALKTFLPSKCGLRGKNRVTDIHSQRVFFITPRMESESGSSEPVACRARGDLHVRRCGIIGIFKHEVPPPLPLFPLFPPPPPSAANFFARSQKAPSAAHPKPLLMWCCFEDTKLILLRVFPSHPTPPCSSPWKPGRISGARRGQWQSSYVSVIY